MTLKKIAFVGFNLNGGGTARVMANLSKFFHENNIEPHIIIIHDETGYEHSGVLYNLGKLKSNKNSIFNKVIRLVKLRRYIIKNNFDFIIDFRFRERLLQEYVISRFVYRGIKTIYTIHSSKLEIYLPKSKYWAKVIYGKSYGIVAITEEMKSLVNTKFDNLYNVSMIYNPVIKDVIKRKSNEQINLDFEYIICVGHFDTNQKQFDKLIETYSKSKLPKENIQLVILGKGTRQLELENLAKTKGVSEKVHFLGFKKNPFKYIAKAKFFVLSSLHEGHPMVVIESLMCGTPVIAFDCPTGPREIISHKENGLLIENQNEEALLEGINTMFLDEKIYQYCKGNAKESVQKFSLDRIGKDWFNLMKINV